MTSPGAQATTTPFPIATGGAPQPITDGGNSPVGMALVNRGDNGGTLWVQAGPAASSGAVPLGPGGTLTWTDPNTIPYVYLSASATKAETLLLTNQQAGYSNPVTVAQQLIQQGVPSTMLDTDYGGYRLLAGQDSTAITVGQSSTLLVSVGWNQPTPLGANVLRLRFDDPASPNFEALDYFLTAPTAISQEQWTWQVPVAAPRLTVTNLATPDNNGSPADVGIVGNNRAPVGGLRMLGAPQPGAQQLWAPTTTVTTQDLYGGAHTGAINSNQPAPYAASGSRCTRFTGACTAQVWAGSAPSSVFLYQNWINAQGQPVSMVYAPTMQGTTGVSAPLTIAHPPVPCYWRLYIGTAAAGTVAQVLIAQN